MKHRNSLQRSLCPVVIYPCLCSSENVCTCHGKTCAIISSRPLANSHVPAPIFFAPVCLLRRARKSLGKREHMPVSVKNNSFSESHRPAVQQQKLLSSPLCGALKANMPTCFNFRRFAFSTDTGSTDSIGGERGHRSNSATTTTNYMRNLPGWLKLPSIT